MTVLLYDNPVSGNCHKVRLILGLRGIEFERRELSVVDRSDRGEVLAGLSPSLNVPTVVLEDGRPLAESNAILWYFADGTPYLPDDPYERAQVLQWMFFEQYKHEPGDRGGPLLGRATPTRPAAGGDDRGQARGRPRRPRARWSATSRDRDFFVGERFTIADIALYAYTHVAPEGGFDLEPYPALRAWLDRVAAAARDRPDRRLSRRECWQRAAFVRGQPVLLLSAGSVAALVPARSDPLTAQRGSPANAGGDTRRHLFAERHSTFTGNPKNNRLHVLVPLGSAVSRLLRRYP